MTTLQSIHRAMKKEDKRIEMMTKMFWGTACIDTMEFAEGEIKKAKGVRAALRLSFKKEADFQNA